MPGLLTQFTEPLSVGNDVYSLTGSLSDGAVAAGFAAWVQSITGSVPVTTRLPGDRVRVSFTAAQIPIMRAWLDNMLKGAVSGGPPPKVEYALGDVINMWAAKYALPTVAAVFIGGIIAGWLLRRYI
jgi:hypothetical protein